MSAVQTPDGWQAELHLQFARRGARTFLAHRRHLGPLLIQRPFHPEPNACHAYIVHPPGGIVGGDRLHLQVTVGEGAHALLTTPAATKFYRSAGSIAQQTQDFELQQGTLEWLPQETIFYRDALARSVTQVRMSKGAKFIGWEIPCLGLPARAEAFDAGELRLNFELWLEEQPLLIDRMRIAGASPARTAAWGLAGYTAVGTMLAYPATTGMLALAREVASSHVAEVAPSLSHSAGEGMEQSLARSPVNGTRQSDSLSLSPGEDRNGGVELTATLVDSVLVCRCVAHQAEHVRKTFITLWQALRPHLLGCAAVPPRIWST